jgi:hypothetical protein
VTICQQLLMSGLHETRSISVALVASESHPPASTVLHSNIIRNRCRNYKYRRVISSTLIFLVLSVLWRCDKNTLGSVRMASCRCPHAIHVQTSSRANQKTKNIFCVVASGPISLTSTPLGDAGGERSSKVHAREEIFQRKYFWVDCLQFMADEMPSRGVARKIRNSFYDGGNRAT